MGKKICPFGDIEIEKNKFYHHKTLIILKDVDNEKLLVFNKISFGEKKKKKINTLLVTFIMKIK